MNSNQQMRYVQFNNLINTLKKEQKLETGEKFPWLDNSDERKYMSDREILRKYINLDNTCSMEEEKEEVMNMLYKYKEAFSLRKIVKVEAPFTDEISSLAIIKLLDKLTHSIMVLKVKFVPNIAMLDMINNTNSETLILNPREALGILDLRSLGYYKIKQGVIQQKVSRFYDFESADDVCTV